MEFSKLKFPAGSLAAVLVTQRHLLALLRGTRTDVNDMSLLISVVAFDRVRSGFLRVVKKALLCAASTPCDRPFRALCRLHTPNNILISSMNGRFAPVVVVRND